MRIFFQRELETIPLVPPYKTDEWDIILHEFLIIHRKITSPLWLHTLSEEFQTISLNVYD